MDNIQKRYGYTGQGLRVNLTTGKITKEPTFPRFKDEIGGTALGYRVFWDEVPPKTQPLDEANKLVIAPGPFSGSGALCSSRTSITTIYPTIYPMPMIASAHIGGDMAARLKQAGYDFIIIEGKSEKPVYLYINNDEVELRDAKGIWGQGTRRAQQMLADQTSPMASIAVIGPAGENLVPMSVLISARQRCRLRLRIQETQRRRYHRRPADPHSCRQERMAEDHRTQHRSVRFSEPARRSVRPEPPV